MKNLSKYMVCWLVIEETKRKKTSKAGLNRINSKVTGYKGYMGFTAMECAYVRHFPNAEKAKEIQALTGGIIVTDAQFGLANKEGNLKLRSDLFVKATKKQLENAK